MAVTPGGPDLFTANLQALSEGAQWMDAQSMLQLAHTARSTDEALAMAEQMRKAKRAASQKVSTSFAMDDRMYQRPSYGMYVQRALKSSIGPLPVTESHLSNTQRYLKDAGYINLPVTGVWTPEWNAAFSQYASDAYARQLQGEHAGSKRTGWFINALSAIAPAKAWDAIWGFVKGMPGDMRTLAGDVAAAGDIIGTTALRLPYRVGVEHSTFEAEANKNIREFIGTTRNVQNIFGADTTAAEQAIKFGMPGADQAGLPPEYKTVVKWHGTGPDRYQVGKRIQIGGDPGLHEIHGWDLAHRVLTDIGTAFIMSSIAKFGAGSIAKAATEAGAKAEQRAVLTAAAEAGAPEEALQAHAAAQKAAIKVLGQNRAAGNIVRVLGRASVEATPLSEVESVAGRQVASAIAERNAAMAVEGAIPGTFGENGSMASQIFENDPLLGRTVNVTRGKWGYYYNLRSMLATPYKFAPTRAIGGVFQDSLTLGAKIRATAAISEIGPGSSELSQQVQGQQGIEKWNERLGMKYHLGPVGANIDDLMFLFHAPLHMGSNFAGTGQQLAESAAAMSDRQKEVYAVAGLPQAFDRAQQMYQTTNKVLGNDAEYTTWEGLIRSLGRRGREQAQQWLGWQFKDYAVQQYAHIRMAEQYDIAVAEAVSEEDHIRLAAMFDPVGENFQRTLRDTITEIETDPTLTRQAFEHASTGLENNGFAEWLAEGFNRENLMPRGRGPGQEWVSEGKTFNGNLGDYMDASRVMSEQFMPILNANLNDTLDELGAAREARSSLNETLISHSAEVERTTTELRVAENELRAEIGSQQSALQQEYEAASAQHEAAVAAHDTEQAAKAQQRLDEITRVINEEVAPRRRIADDARQRYLELKAQREGQERFYGSASAEDRGATVGLSAKELRARERQLTNDLMANDETLSRRAALKQARAQLAATPKSMQALIDDEQKALTAYETAKANLNEVLTQYNVTERGPRAKSRFNVSAITLPSEFDAVASPETVRALEEATAARDAASAAREAGPAILSDPMHPLRVAADTARTARNDTASIHEATKRAFENMGFLIDAARNMNPMHIGIAKLTTLTRHAANEALQLFALDLERLAPQTEYAVGAEAAVTAEEQIVGQRRRLTALENELERTRNSAPGARLEGGKFVDGKWVPADVTRAAWERQQAERVSKLEQKIQDVRSEIDRLQNSGEIAQSAATRDGAPQTLAEWDQQVREWAHWHMGIDASQMTGIANDRNDLLGVLRNRAQGFAGRVQFDPARMDPRLDSAIEQLHELGYQLVYGDGMGHRFINDTPLDAAAWNRRGFVRRLIANSGFSPLITTDTEIRIAQRNGQLTYLNRLLARDPSMRRVGMDGGTILDMLFKLNNGELGEAIPATAGQRMKSGLADMFGWVRRGEQRAGTRLRVPEHPGDLGWLAGTAHAQAMGEDAKAFQRALQLRDIPRKQVIELLTDTVDGQRAGAWDHLFGPESGFQPFTEQQANRIYDAVRRGYSSVPWGFMGLSQLDNIGRSLAGLIAGGHWATVPVAGAAAGAGFGAFESHMRGESWGQSLDDIAMGAALGAAMPLAAGFSSTARARMEALSWAMANVPNKTKTLMNTFRFELSPMFSIRRLVKTNVKMGLEGVKPTLTPLQDLERLTGGPDGAVAGRDVLQRVFPELVTANSTVVDDADRILRQEDVFHLYNGTAYEQYAAYHLDQMGLSDTEIRDKLIHMFNYGKDGQLGRSAAERSANFVFFPLSFDKTLYRNVGMYLLDRPAQRLVLQQGVAMYDLFSKNYPNTPGATEWVKKYMPILEEVQKVNAFEHGVGLGELGGINAPLAQLFLPQKWSSTPDNTKLLERFLPVLKDGHQLWGRVVDQWAVGTAAVSNAEKIYLSPDKGTLPGGPGAQLRSLIAPSQQLSEAYKYQRSLYDQWAPQLAYNNKQHTDAGKYRFPMDAVWGEYAGQPITKANIREIVHDVYPAYDPLGAAKFVMEGQRELAQYVRSKAVEDPLLARNVDVWAKNVKTLADGLAKVDSGELPAGVSESQAQQWLQQVTAALRPVALWMAEHHPDFIPIYNNNFRRVLGPLEKLG